MRSLAWCALVLVLGAGAARLAHAQQAPVSLNEFGLVSDTLSAAAAQPYLLNPFVRPGSVAVFAGATVLDSAHYRVDYRSSRLWVDSLYVDEPLVVRYRTWGLGLRPVYRREFVVADSSVATLGADEAGGPDPGETEPGSLQRSGSITRGILAGNRRDATIESGLRLQLAGQVSDDVGVRAVLTDESTPILPEGTTQRLSEIDRVFIEIDARRARAQLGDIDVAYDGSEFARFSRKVQGVGATGQSGPATLRVMGATARGIYWSQEIEVLDGVQGPYRLSGEQGERFIFIVPGSEVVYIDGEPLERGETKDYVIDYATGEVTFTATRLVRADNRVRAEYQYRTTEFTRTVLGAEAEVELGRRTEGPPRLMLAATVLREADGRTFDQELGLTEADRGLLSIAGDSAVFKSGASQVAYDAEAPYVQYVRRDTLIDGAATAYFVPVITAPQGAVYRVRFTPAGPGQGSYVRQGQTANGIAYSWRGPGGGDYEPVRVLPKPREHRMLDIRGAFAPGAGIEVFGEWARSALDLNRFSGLHGEDDAGAAYVAGFRMRPQRLGPGPWGTLALEARRRQVRHGFAPFDRIRPIEFARRWNLDGRRSSNFLRGDELSDEARLDWAFGLASRARAEIGRIVLADGFEGTRNEVQLEISESRIPRASYRHEFIRSRDPLLAEDGEWVRLRGLLEQPIRALVPGLEIERERRHMRADGTRSLTAASHAFTELRPQVAWQQDDLALGALVEFRREDRISGDALSDAERVLTMESNFDVRPVRALKMEGRAGWRSRDLAEGGQQNSIVLRWTGNWQPGQRLLRLNWHYEALSERTPVLQEIYIRTGAEIGEFVWRDDNADGVVQIDEFVPETTQDEGVYVRTFLPSDMLQSVTGLQSRFSVEFAPGRRWRSATETWKRRLSNVSTRTSLQIREKSSAARLSDVYLMRLSRFRSPDHTLRGLLNFRQDLFLFRNQTGYGVDASLRTLRSLNALAAGIEMREVDAFGGQAWVRPSSSWQVRLRAETDRKKTDSETFSSRSYDIRSWSAEPELVLSPSTRWRFVLSAAAARKRARAADVWSWRFPLSAAYSRAGKASITARVEGARVAIDGAAPAGMAYYEITDGRGLGTSFLWNLTAWYQLTATLRANLAYNGRSPEAAPVIHTIRMQLSAAF